MLPDGAKAGLALCIKFINKKQLKSGNHFFCAVSITESIGVGLGFHCLSTIGFNLSSEFSVHQNNR